MLGAGAGFSGAGLPVGRESGAGLPGAGLLGTGFSGAGRLGLGSLGAGLPGAGTGARTLVVGVANVAATLVKFGVFRRSMAPDQEDRGFFLPDLPSDAPATQEAREPAADTATPTEGPAAAHARGLVVAA